MIHHLEIAGYRKREDRLFVIEISSLSNSPLHLVPFDPSILIAIPLLPRIGGTEELPG
jgi:hypothetical protein